MVGLTPARASRCALQTVVLEIEAMKTAVNKVKSPNVSDPAPRALTAPAPCGREWAVVLCLWIGGADETAACVPMQIVGIIDAFETKSRLFIVLGKRRVASGFARSCVRSRAHSYRRVLPRWRAVRPHRGEAALLRGGCFGDHAEVSHEAMTMTSQRMAHVCFVIRCVAPYQVDHCHPRPAQGGHCPPRHEARKHSAHHSR